MDGSCWDRFGRKTLLTFTGYKDRAPGVMKELERVGMNDVHVQWQFPNPFDNVLKNRLSHVRLLENSGFFNCVMGHYRAIKTAYCLGLNNCLVMEDDIRFMRDLDKLKEIIADAPSDADILLFDVLRPQKIALPDFVQHVKSDRVSRYWVKFVNARSAGCYALNRKAMERWINAFERPALGNGDKMRLPDQYFNIAHVGLDLKAYHAAPVAARQVLVGSGRCNSDFLATYLDSFYEAIGCDPEAYGK